MTTGEAREVTRHERLIDDLRIPVSTISPAGARTGWCSTSRRRWHGSSALPTRPTVARRSCSCSATTAPPTRVRQINVILLQNLHARLFPAQLAVRPINDDFQAVDELLDLRDDELFVKRPSAILDSFLTLQEHPELKGMSAHMLRALWRNRGPCQCRFPPRPGKSCSIHGPSCASRAG